MSVARRTCLLAAYRWRSQWLTTRRHSTQSGGLSLNGIFPPIPTPFNSDESIAYDQLHRNMEKWQRIPFAGYVIQGSNGEYPFLSAEERVQVVRAVKEMIGDSKLLIAGSGCESTRATIEMTEKMANAGADAVLVVNPCYYKGQMSDSVLVSHFTAVADSSPVPVILYSVPGNTGIDVGPEAIVTLCSHRNIVGLKDSGGDVAKLGGLVRRTAGHDFQILAGSASFLLPSYVAGCVGGVCALANVLGDAVCQLHRSHQENRPDPDLQRRLIDPNQAVTKRFGVSGLKAALDMFGFYGGPTRRPLPVPDVATQRTIRQIFIDSGFPPPQ